MENQYFYISVHYLEGNKELVGIFGMKTKMVIYKKKYENVFNSN
jgi:hypothetical protein